MEKGRKIVFGIDGTPYSLLRTLISEGHMPALKELCDKGSFTQITSSIPEVSSVAWTSFMTGVNPAAHRIFGFIELKPNSYETFFPTSRHRKAPAFWETLEKDGKSCVALNIPQTYPATPIKGVLASGFVAIALEKAIYPQKYLPYFKKSNYVLDLDFSLAQKDPAAFVRSAIDSVKIRREITLKLWDEIPWSILTTVITETDRLFHFFWSDLENPASELHAPLRSFFKEVDVFIGSVWEKAQPEDRFIIMSDHGFTGIKREVFINAWLKELGLLEFEKEEPEQVSEIRPGSKAFALDPARIFINVKGKFPGGSVNNGREYDSIRDRIAEEARTLKDPETGEVIIDQVHRKEDVYRGAFLDEAADLILIGNGGYNLKGAVKSKEVFTQSRFSGAHTFRNAALMVTNLDRESPPQTIEEVYRLLIE